MLRVGAAIRRSCAEGRRAPNCIPTRSVGTSTPLITRYSYRSASIGSSRVARMAG